MVKSFITYCQLQGLSRRTIEGIEYALRTLQKSHPDLLTVNSQQILQFFCRGREQGFASGKPASASTYNNIRKYLKKFYSWLKTNEYVKSNPIDSIPACKSPKRLPRRIGDEQMLKILYHAQNFQHPSKFLRLRNYAIVSTFLTIGIRADELLNISNTDVDLKDKSIRIRHGKGDKERVVYFNNQLLFILRDYMEAKKKIKKESPYFFVSYGSNQKLRYTNLRRMLKIISQRSGVVFSAHMLRHTCFSKMAEQQIDIPTIGAQAGHASLMSTQIYLHTTASHRKNAISRLDFLQCK